MNSSTERKTWQVYGGGKRNVLQLHLNEYIYICNFQFFIAKMGPVFTHGKISGPNS